QMIVLASGSEIGLDDLPPALRDGRAPGVPSGTGDEPAEGGPATASAVAPAGGAATAPATFKEAKQLVVERFERRFIADALARHHGNVSKAAEDMGMYRQHLQLKLSEYGIDPETYRRRS